MRGSAVWSFSDPEQFERSIRAGTVSGYWAGRGSFRADLAQIDLGKVWLQRIQEYSPRSARIAVLSSRSAVLFRTPHGTGALRHRGIDIDNDTLVFPGAAVEDRQAIEGPNGIGSMSLSPQDLARFGPLLAERDLVAPSTTRVLRPEPAAFARMRELHAAAVSLAHKDPGRIRHPEVNRAFEDSFISAMIACLAGAEPVRISRAGERRAALMRRMEDFLSSQRGVPIYVTELCGALAVTERSLERACQDHLGMGPKRYLWLRRLHMARLALIATDRSHATVAQIALAHGFWELGRFAVRYHEFFGEPPSATLR
jgi:AraC-like DNA-binding protein